jgi:hypothetical protein
VFADSTFVWDAASYTLTNAGTTTPTHADVMFSTSSGITVSDYTYTSTLAATGLYYLYEGEDIYLNRLTTYAETITTTCVTTSTQAITYQLQNCVGSTDDISWITFDDSTSQLTGTTLDVGVQTTYQV